MTKFLLRFLFVMVLGAGAFYVSETMTEPLIAQETTVEAQPKNIAKTAPATSADFLSRYKARIDNNAALAGPWDVVVGTTDKADNAIKYSNVPFVYLGNGFVAFPSGTSTKGKPDYIITSNFTLYMKQ